MDIKNKEVFNMSHFKKGRKVYEMSDSLIGDECYEVNPELTLKVLIVRGYIFNAKGRWCGFVNGQTFDASETDFTTDLFHNQDDGFAYPKAKKKSYYIRKKDRNDTAKI
jgi:hypothetical protein